MRPIAFALLFLLLTLPAALRAGWKEGQAAFEAEDFQSALVEFVRMAEADPEDYRPLLMMGRSLEELGRTLEAVRFFERAREIRPRNRLVLAGLGRTMLDLGRAERALPMLSRAVDQAPEDGSTRVHLARALVLLERPEEALRAVQGLDLDGFDRETQARYHGARGAAALQLGEPGEALVDLERAVTFEPSNARYHYLLGTSALALGRSERALAALRYASLLDPENSTFRRAYERARDET